MIGDVVRVAQRTAIDSLPTLARYGSVGLLFLLLGMTIERVRNFDIRLDDGGTLL